LISTTTARKISVLVASVIPALCLLAICLVGKNVLVVVVLTILAVMFYGSMFSGVLSNQSDLAPNFAGTLMAVTNMLATIPGKMFLSLSIFSLFMFRFPCSILGWCSYRGH
jgi:ACS family sodium-dependent inorganic phosphate cotransporter